MILPLYLALVAVGFLFMALGFVREEAYLHETAAFVSAILFLSLGFLSWNIEVMECGLTTADVWSCHREVVGDPALSALFYGLGILGLAMTIIMALVRISDAAFSKRD